MKRREAVTIAALGMAAAGCAAPALLPPEGSVELFVDTDAPLPSAPGVMPDPQAPTPLFDTVRIEVFPAGQSTPCDGCTREFDVNMQILQTGASIDVRSASSAAGTVARVRMFQSSMLLGGEPPPGGTVETVVALPVQPAFGTTQVTAVLSTDSVGFPVGTLADPVAPEAGAPDGTLVGTWSGATPVPCSGAPKTSEVCVHGGAYWMGNVNVTGSVEYASNQVRLVVLSPFFMDDHEATVAEFLAGGGNIVADTVNWSAAATTDEINYWCTPGRSDPTLTLNCVNYPSARAYCTGRGGDLPTEAQLEYAEGGLVSNLFVWGLDLPACTDAVWGLGGGGGFTATYPNTCLASSGGEAITMLGGLVPLPADDSSRLMSRGRDHLDLPGGTLWDLAGNLSEYARDGFEPQTGPCWTHATSNVFVDPVCPQQTNNPNLPVTLRGGSWMSSSGDLPAASRFAANTNNGSGGLYGFIDVGLRCVWPAADQ